MQSRSKSAREPRHAAAHPICRSCAVFAAFAAEQAAVKGVSLHPHLSWADIDTRMTTALPFDMHVGCLHHRPELPCCSSLRKSHLALLCNRRCFGQQISANKTRNRRATGAAVVSAASVTERFEKSAAQNPIRPLRHPFASWHQWWYIGKPCNCCGALERSSSQASQLAPLQALHLSQSYQSPRSSAGYAPDYGES